MATSNPTNPVPVHRAVLFMIQPMMMMGRQQPVTQPVLAGQAEAGVFVPGPQGV